LFELRTTTLRALDHPELILAFEDETLRGQGQYWIDKLPSWVEAGHTFEVGTIPNLDGWPVVPVRREDGALALHARMLENYRQGKSVLLLDGHARFAQAQRTFAQPYGAFEPPHWLSSVLVCPRWIGHADVLTREASDGNATGWVIKCDTSHCSAAEHDERHHCPKDAWLTIDVAELAVARPGLVQLLGLPYGSRLEHPFTSLMQVDAIDLEYAHDIARLARSLPMGHLNPVAPTVTTGAPDAPIVLAFESESQVYEETSDYFVLPDLRERYALSEAAAKATLARAWSPDRLLAYARWKYRDLLPNELRDVVEATLDVVTDDRWKAINDAARKLVPLTQQPFITWKPIVEGFDKLYQRAKNPPAVR
jgi:hypothetical protein